MHVEFFTIQLDVVRNLLVNEGVLTAVGTTSLRALESIYWIGVKMLHHNSGIDNLFLDQWEAYTLPQNITIEQSLSKVCETLERRQQTTVFASTKIMIIPGYTFKICRRLITNFHQPQSTLLLLVSAFVGERWKDIYQYALENDFRFLSYGDSSMLEVDCRLRDSSREEKYRDLMVQIDALTDGEPDLIANLANVAAALKQTFGFFWVGFYLVKDGILVLGPFQGPTACTRIVYGRGVCGTAWKEQKTIIVPDVHLFAGHIACNSESKSEIVVPLLSGGEVIGVLDIDSNRLNDFDETDAYFLEKIVRSLENSVTLSKVN